MTARRRGVDGPAAYLAIGAVFTAILNVSSHARGAGSIATALGGEPGLGAAGRALLQWVVGPLLLWPVWLPLAIIDALRRLFRDG